MINLLAFVVAAHASAATPAVATPENAPAANSAPAAPAPAPTTKPAEELDAAAEARIKSVEDCVDTLEYFRDDLKNKKAALEKEFKGQIPTSFANLINLKTNRVAKQQQACVKVIGGADQPIDASMASARMMDGSSAAYAARRKKLDGLRERLNKAQKRFSGPNQ